jgi:hypothetical protein
MHATIASSPRSSVRLVVHERDQARQSSRTASSPIWYASLELFAGPVTSPKSRPGQRSTVVNLTEEEWGSLVDDRVPDAEEVSNPLLTAEFERRLRDDVLPQAREFVQQLEHADLVLLKCWYASNPQPALYWFSRIVKNPDYRARRLGLNPCSREFLDYGKTRIGRVGCGPGLESGAGPIRGNPQDSGNDHGCCVIRTDGRLCRTGHRSACIPARGWPTA